MANRNAIINYLIKLGREPLTEPRKEIRFTPHPEVNAALNDLDAYPHLFLLGFLMDSGVDSARAWEIPYRVTRAFNLDGYAFDEFAKLSRDQLESAFIAENLHRYPSRMARRFHDAIRHLAENYNGNAARLWFDAPASATLVRRLIQFQGMGLRDARAAANILFRYFKIPLADARNLDITPDAFVKRMFRRFGFINRHGSDAELLYIARELYPTYPGIFDHPCWDIANRVCKAQRPLCGQCELQPYCPKII